MSKQLQKLAGLCLLFTLCFFTKQTTVSASNILGADISYKYISGSSYKVYVIIYRDCNGIPLKTVTVGASDGSTINYYKASSCCSQDVTPVAKGQCSRCSSPTCSFPFGITKDTFSVNIDISVFSGCNIKFLWEECCWGAISNVSTSNPAQYVECLLNRCVADHNSPAFNAEVPMFLASKTLYDNYQTAEVASADDSIVYKLVNPTQGAFGGISYYKGFSYLSPISISGNVSDKKPYGFHYEAHTGEMYFTPSASMETSLMAMEADEYKKDNTGKYYLMGTASRILVVIVNDFGLGNQNPVISSPSISSNDSIYACNNVPINFTVNTKDPDLGDTAKLTFENGTGGTIAVTGKINSVVSYSWTPKLSEIRKEPYILTITARDNATPMYGQTKKRLYIFVKDSLPNTGISLVDSGCGRYHFSLKKPVYKDFKVTWLFDTIHVSNLRDVSYRNVMAGKHVVSLIISNGKGCSETYADTVKYDTIYHIQKPETGICLGASVHLATAKGSNLQWSPSKGLSDSLAADPVASPKVTTLYTVKGKDISGCVFTDQTRIMVSDYKITTSGNIVKCSDKAVKFSVQSVPGASYTLVPDSGLTTAGDTFIVAPHQSTLYKISANYKGCIKTDSLHVYVKQASLSIGGDRSYCGKDSLLLQSPVPAKAYAWLDEAHPGVILGTSMQLLIKKRGFTGKLLITDTLGCRDTSNVVKVSYAPFLPATSGNTHICYGDSVMLSAYGGNRYMWALGKAIISGKSSIKVSPVVTTVYAIAIFDTITGCQGTDSLRVTVGARPGVSAGASICQGDSAPISATGGNKYTWEPATGLSSANSGKISASPKATTSYHVTIQDTILGCSAKDSVLVTVNDCVWPGDANKDKTADYLDVLNIGLAYKTTGPARGTSASLWQAYKTADWAKSTVNGTNLKHIDCNGDGVIDAKDTSVISANYGKKHTKWTTATGGDPKNPHVYFKFVKDTFYAGELATAYLYAGDSKIPLTKAYGIGFQAQHVAAPMVTGSAKYFAECDYFCNGSELNYFKPDYTNNATDATVVETNHSPTLNSYGKFAGISFKLKDSLSFSYPKNGEKIYAKLMSATVIDSAGKEIEVYGVSDSAIVLKQKKLGIDRDQAFSQHFQIYPNPATHQITIVGATGAAVQQITIYNGYGQQMEIATPTQTQTNTIDISSYPPGLYFIQLKTTKGTAREKMVIQR